MIHMNKSIPISLLAFLFVIFISPVSAQTQSEGELTLPMPGGGSMSFVPVCVNSDDGLFSWKMVKLGDPAGGFKEHPTTMALGGAFHMERNGRKVWCYYMGKYEVTQDEYYALMPKAQGVKVKKAYPVTGISWFDAVKFADRYNRWLYENASDKMPRYDKAYGFLRLPTEAEWEFAARGASAVSSDFFDRPIPYPAEKLQEYEWFGGPSSSHYKLQPSGRLKPNPAGLYDMLGNADEMTLSLFKVEYYQGRSGGFVLKGGNYMTAAKRLRSGYRAEQPFYRLDREKKLVPHTKKTLGFRLLISSLVFPSRRVLKEMASEWGSYRKTRGADTPAALSTAPSSSRTYAKGEDAFKYLSRVEKQLQKKGLSDTAIKDSMGRLSDSIRDIMQIRTRKEEDASYLWIRIANEQARFIRNEYRKLPIVEKLIAIAKGRNDVRRLSMYEKRLREHEANIENSLSTYSESIRQIADNSSAAAEKGFKRYLDFLMSRNKSAQVQLLGIVRRNYDEYLETKRVDTEKWRKEIEFLN